MLLFCQLKSSDCTNQDKGKEGYDSNMEIIRLQHFLNNKYTMSRDFFAVAVKLSIKR